MAAFKAGAAITDISPGPGIQMTGYPPHTRENRGIHDPLYASALYLNDGSSGLLVICADVVYWDKVTVARAREEIGRQSGIASERIMLSATHTHSGPRIDAWLDQQDQRYGYKV